MKVLAVIADGTRGGAQRHVRDLLTRAEDATFVLATGSEGELTADVRALGIRVHVIPGLARAASPLQLPGASRALRSVIAAERPSVVHAHGVKAATACAGTRVPFVCTSHGSAAADPTRSFAQRAVLRRLERRHASLLTTFIGVSKAECAGAARAGVPAGRIVHIPNGVPVSTAPQAHQGPVRNVAFVGRLVPEKGADALPLLAQRLAPGVTLHVAGDGPLAGRLGGLKNVRLHGWVEDVPAFLAGMDVLVLPSQKEGLPYALLEAMERAKPVVATAVGGVVDVVTHGRNGLLVETGDVEGLASAVNHLVNHSEEGQALGQAARQTVMEDYRVEDMLRRTLDVYEAAAGEAAPWRA